MSEQMTREQILAMEPGRELDALIADKVMGWKECGIEGLRTRTAWGKPSHFDCNDPRVRIPGFSTDISAAWEVEVQFNQDSEVKSDYMIGLYMIVGLQPHLKPSLDDLFLIAHATPEQRCKAALLAVMVL